MKKNLIYLLLLSPLLFSSCSNTNSKYNIPNGFVNSPRVRIYNKDKTATVNENDVSFDIWMGCINEKMKISGHEEITLDYRYVSFYTLLTYDKENKYISKYVYYNEKTDNYVPKDDELRYDIFFNDYIPSIANNYNYYLKIEINNSIPIIIENIDLENKEAIQVPITDKNIELQDKNNRIHYDSFYTVSFDKKFIADTSLGNISVELRVKDTINNIDASLSSFINVTYNL